MDFDAQNLSKGGTNLKERKECVRLLFSRSKESIVDFEECLVALIQGKQSIIDAAKAKLDHLDDCISKYCDDLDVAASEEEQKKIIGEIQLPTEK